MDYQKRLALNPRLYYVANFFAGLSFVIPIWVLFYQRYLTFAEIGILNAFFFLVTLLLELPTGALADLIGRKKTILLGYAIMSVGYIYVAFGHDFWTFGISYLIRGVGEALVSGADTALVYDSFKELGRTEDFPKQVAKSGFLHRMGLVVGSFFGGYLYTVSPGLPWIAVGVSLSLSFLVLLFLVEPHIDSVKFTLKNYLTQTKEGFKHVFRTTHGRKLAYFYVFIGGITWSCLTYFNQTYATDLGFTAGEMSILFGVLYLLSSLAVLYLTHHHSILTRKRVYIGLPILMFLAYLPAVFVTKLTVAPFIFLMIFTGSGRFAFLDGYVNEEFSSNFRATAISSLNMMVSILAMLLISTGGFIQDRYNTQVILTSLGVFVAVFLIPWGVDLLKEHRNSVGTK